jgi:HlyD family secretion protein
LIVAAAAVAALLVAAFIVRALTQPHVAYITAPVVRKDLVQSVTATGTVNPQDTILVGTQVSGTITEQDADYNTVVKKGQILTRLDPTSFQAQLDAAESAEGQAASESAASLASASSAQANAAVAHQNIAVAREALASAQSQVSKAKAALYLATVTLNRDRSLLSQGYIAQSQFDTDASNAAAAKSAYDAAVIAVPQAQAQVQAQIAAAQASVAQVRSAIAGAKASQQAIGVQSAAVAQARYNFDNAVIRSQVNGTVIARNITIGQTVAASFTTPTLFTIGRDLKKMEVDVAVGEPDIGGVRAGDAVDFTVLAYPNRTFHGTVYQVRQNPTTVNNVVTYDTVVYVENKDGALYPGMTANASIHVAKAAHALVVPITALQWAPPAGQRIQAPQTAASPSSPWGTTEASLTRTIVAGRNGRLFLLHGGQLARVPVRVILVSDTEAAVLPLNDAKLEPGDTVIASDTSTQMASQKSNVSSALTRQPSTPSGGSH